MAALANSLSLIAISGLIGWEAWSRLRGPAPHIDAPIMFGVAAMALAANLGIARLLSQGQSASENLNVRAALLHVIGDAAGSAGVLTGGVLIALRPGWWAIDPLLSFGIAAVIVWGAWRLLVEVVNVLMEGTPTGIAVEDVERCMTTIDGVHAVHHVHVWAITPGINDLSRHVVIDDQSLSTADLIRRRVLEVLKREYHVDHATLQMEHEACGAVCTLHHSASRE